MRYRDGGDLDEFGWEEELRQEDARLRAYLNELPKFIDLPGEDDILVRRMAHHPELVSETPPWQSGGYEAGDFDLDDDFGFPADWRRRPGADIYLGLQGAAQQWCRVFASRLDRDTRGEGLRIIAVYGLLIGLAIDLIYMEEEEMPALKVALLKRLQAGFNQLCGQLQGIAHRHSELSISCRSQGDQLQELRRLTLDLMGRYRKRPPP